MKFIFVHPLLYFHYIYIHLYILLFALKCYLNLSSPESHGLLQNVTSFKHEYFEANHTRLFFMMQHNKHLTAFVIIVELYVSVDI